MSADEPQAWKLTLPCTRDEAEAIALADLDLPAVLMTSEVDEAAAQWRLDAYFDGEPDPATVAAIRELAASGGWSSAQPSPIPEQDWVTLSQAGLEPIREGRFVVHTAAHPVDAAPNVRRFRIEAGQAFGTGHHQTTAGCLAMLDGLADARFANIVDLGTGTGLLAFAARHLWPGAAVLATDIDPIAVAVTRENAEANAVPGVDLLVADGARNAAIITRVPFDLIVANILAGPLIAMAAEIAAIAAPGAQLVLAGLLTRQADEVTQAYAAQGFALAASDVRGDWTILRLVAGAGRASGDAPAGDRAGWASDR
ncbi:50S ribosomal protein L11 methyltransferase [Sphingomonas bacterium]|uniref:50S ribosomal protein L11 methyltransferase n=1 Tax=Sphingomonas bacterium TaxID=1895847 RepID=UPI001576B880|nr:50S ribosomal protein L11 methyltransferase [Sphingomonas bacterium]